jgi:hypothetical protein
MLGSWMSSVKMARPVTLAGASRRGTLRPTTAWVSRSWPKSGSGGAAAEVAAERGLDVVVGGVRVAVDEGFGRHHHAGCAVAALDGALGDERLLQRMHRTVRREPFDGRHRVAVGRDREH